MNNSRFSNDIVINSKGLITYIMSDSFRIHYNHGLNKALELCEMYSLELQIVLFRVKEENERNNLFFTKGISGYQGFLSKFTNNVYYFEETTDFFYKVLKKSTTVIKDKAYLKEHLALQEKIQHFLDAENIIMPGPADHPNASLYRWVKVVSVTGDGTGTTNNIGNILTKHSIISSR